MGKQSHYVDVRPYLRLALTATFGVLIAPVAIVLTLALALHPAPSILVLASVGVGLALVSGIIGAAVWHRRPESADIGFDELMIWGWLHRRRVDERLERGTRMLGLDRAGAPVDDVHIAPDQQLEVLHDLTGALESKDPYTHGHSQRVARHSYRTAFAMGLGAAEIEELRTAAALHDVGKIRVPDRILRKPSGLTIEERAVVEDHVVVGAWMVSQVGSAAVVSAVRHHHERWDGLGYPDGLVGADIPLFARIIAVADTYDAVTSTRPYRAGSGREDAIEVLREGAGSQFDPAVVRAFESVLPLRLPVAGALAIFAAPQALWRNLAVWFRRLGLGNLAPAAGGVGAAVLLAGFIATPAGAVHHVSPRPAFAAPARASEGGASNTAPIVKGKKIERTLKTKPVAPHAGARGRAPLSDVVLGGRLHRHPSAGVVVTHPNGPTGVPGPKPTPPRSPAPQPSPTPSSAPPSSPSQTPDANNGKPKGDPQPDKGSDCSHPRNGDDSSQAHCP